MIWTDFSQDTQRLLTRLASDDFDAGKPDFRWIGRIKAFFHDLFALSDSTITAEDRYDPILLMPELSCTGSFIAYDFLRARIEETEDR